MFLDWVLCHRDGQEKGQLGEREVGSTVNIRINGENTANAVVSSEENLSRTIHPGRTRMKVRMHATGTKKLLHNGVIVQPKSSWLTTDIPSVGPHFRLLNAHAARVYEVGGDNSWEPNTDTELELSDLMWKLIQSAGRRIRYLNDAEFDPGFQAPTLGIIEGTLANTGTTRTWNPYDLNTAWDALVNYSRKKNFPDFELKPLDREDGIHAEFNTFFSPDETADIEIIFELGQNLVDIGWEPSIVEPGLCNQYILMGETSGGRAPCYVAENKESMNHLGLYSRIESASTELEMDQIEFKAKEYVGRRAWPQHFFDMVLPVEIGGTAEGWSRNALGEAIPLDQRFMVPPTYGVDYNLGDIVKVRVHNRFKFGIENDLPGDALGVDTDFAVRVTGVQFEEIDKAGNVMVTIESHPVIDTAAVTGYAGYIAVDPD